jgi:hypothetical protein
MIGSVLKVLLDLVIILYMEGLVFIDAAEAAFVVGASNGNLKNDAVSLTGRADYWAFVVHGFKNSNRIAEEKIF